MIEATYLHRQRERETLQRQLELAHAHADLNGNIFYEEESQDEEQEWDPAAAEFMVRKLRIIKTESGNATVGNGKQDGDEDENNLGSEISLF